MHSSAALVQMHRLLVSRWQRMVCRSMLDREETHEAGAQRRERSDAAASQWCAARHQQLLARRRLMTVRPSDPPQEDYLSWVARYPSQGAGPSSLHDLEPCGV